MGERGRDESLAGRQVLIEQRQKMDPFVLKLVAALEIPVLVVVCVVLLATRAPWHVMPILLVAMAAGPLLIAQSRLIVRVREDQLRYAFVPFWRGGLGYDRIERVEVVQVNAMRDFGGWGPKVNTKATGYIARSGGAVRITRTDARRALVLTSDDPEELAAAIMERVVAAGEEQLRV